MAIVIAEAGTNHASSNRHERLVNALCLAKWAKFCGADAVKFQLFLPDEPLFCPMEGDEKRWKRWEQTFMAPDAWFVVRDWCEAHEIELILSAFQNSGVDLVNELGIRHKVASRAAESYPYEKIPEESWNSIGSSGMAWPETVFVLQCVSEYPASLFDCSWNKDSLYDSPPPCNGISDHSGTIWPAINALARGAEIVEVHFRPVTFDPGPDESVELTTEQLKMICDARDAFAEMRSD